MHPPAWPENSINSSGSLHASSTAPSLPPATRASCSSTRARRGSNTILQVRSPRRAPRTACSSTRPLCEQGAFLDDVLPPTRSSSRAAYFNYFSGDLSGCVWNARGLCCMDPQRRKLKSGCAVNIGNRHEFTIFLEAHSAQRRSRTLERKLCRDHR